MTEPVAWRYKDCGYDRLTKEKPKPEWDYKDIEPLYTLEQLQPRVKMTKKDAEKWDKFYKAYYGVKFRIALERLETDNRYIDFYRRFAYNSESVAVFAKMFAEYNPDNPDETIEIIPEKKWFVQIKNENEKTRFLHKNLLDRNHELNYGSLKYYAKHFDTKEEAEKWTNPLTEAVQLPVEDKNNDQKTNSKVKRPRCGNILFFR